jgi:DNA-binding MarR family transcriptional regulator
MAPVGERQLEAWVFMLHAYARIMARLSADLDQAGKVPLGTYDVLVQLSESGGQLRLRDLVRKVLLSQPGLSRKVERMEADGLVVRKPDPTDGRGVIVALTRSGRAALRSAAIVHMAGIDREFGSRLTEEETAMLARVFARLEKSDE